MARNLSSTTLDDDEGLITQLVRRRLGGRRRRRLGHSGKKRHTDAKKPIEKQVRSAVQVTKLRGYRTYISVAYVVAQIPVMEDPYGASQVGRACGVTPPWRVGGGQTAAFRVGAVCDSGSGCSWSESPKSWKGRYLVAGEPRFVHSGLMFLSATDAPSVVYRSDCSLLGGDGISERVVPQNIKSTESVVPFSLQVLPDSWYAPGSCSFNVFRSTTKLVVGPGDLEARSPCCHEFNPPPPPSSCFYRLYVLFSRPLCRGRRGNAANDENVVVPAGSTSCW